MVDFLMVLFLLSAVRFVLVSFVLNHPVTLIVKQCVVSHYSEH